MANLNKVMLIGRLTRDPELRYTPKGTAVADVGMAVNRRWSNDQGEQEETTFIDVTLWGRQAEVAQQYLAKGSPVYIEGRLRMETWEDKNTGQKRSKLTVVGENMQFLSDGRGGGGQDRSAAPPQQQSEPPAQSQGASPAADDLDDDDTVIPF